MHSSHLFLSVAALVKFMAYIVAFTLDQMVLPVRAACRRKATS
jgi:hypothetical protein